MLIQMRSFIIVMFLCFTCCNKESVENSYIEKRLPQFNEIELNGVFDVYLRQDSTYNLKIQANDNWIDQIHVKVENNKLIIDNESRKRWMRPKEEKVKLYITSNRPKKITANETCYIETVNPIISEEFGLIMTSKLNQANLELDCKTFYYWNNHPCGGKITLRGKAAEIKLWNFAIMQVDAKNLISEYALVENSSKGVCEVNVQSKLEYSIHGSGNIHLYGNPSEIIEHKVTSSGKLVQQQ